VTQHTVQATSAQQFANTMKADPMMVALANATPAQIQTYVQNNVTNLAQAQTAIAFLAKCLVYLWQRMEANP
jgi:hypothetical protein